MSFFESLFENNNKVVSGLTDELKCIYIVNTFLKQKKSVLFVCNSLFEANKMYNSLKNYSEDVLFFPMDDFIASEVLAISPEFLSTRLEVLNSLKKEKKIVVTNLMGYLRFLPKPKLFYSKYITLLIKEDCKIENLVKKLYSLGYKREVTVNKPGEISVRGYIVDIFPINYDNPIRIEFWGDNIDEMRIFDINTQLGISSIEMVSIIPNTEFIIDVENSNDNYLHSDLQKYGAICNIKEYLLDSICVYNDYSDLLLSNEMLLAQIKDFCLEQKKDMTQSFMYNLKQLVTFDDINLCRFDDLSGQNYSSFSITENFENINRIPNILNEYIKQYGTVVICLSNLQRINKVLDLILDNVIFTDVDNIIKGKINLIIKNINEGFIFKNHVVISEQEFFSIKTKPSTYKSNFKIGSKIKDINKLEFGDYVVHDLYGIGKYCGIKTLTKNDMKKDYLKIEYKNEDYLYIPVEKIELINKYSSNGGGIPRLNKLGSLDWQQVKIKTRKKASSIAKDLIKLYALRETIEGFSFEEDDENQILFEKEFAYIPTDSQIKAMNEIKEDMESPHPMDRLICGDVGYGKTELAFRAAFKAILSNKQVVLLCPTTILSNQHFQNAIDRFKSFPVNIKLLNRFSPPKETEKTIKGLKEGIIDFVIGTHKLLNDKIIYKNLGLLIIDEEQRFGVSHKEKIKKYRNNIDVLALSATPIPRTLQLSMFGVRSLSLLETPPKDRYPIQTYVVSYNKSIIKDAIYREMSRGGQVFILYNKIAHIERKTAEIQELVKDAKIVYAHGQLSKNELENRMMQFINKNYDVLICTTIIETGIDIPNANTLIIIDADNFGLSQLYQLRGRVGRTNRISYCYLMHDNKKILSEISRKRLNAIKEFTELGSGFSIAVRDLTLRGAGDVLGSEQAGFIDSVGIELFTKILKEEIDKLKGIVVEEIQEENRALIDVDTYVDDSYVEEEILKIEIHRMINNVKDKSSFTKIKKDLKDRFGSIPKQMDIYMHEQWFETIANKINIRRVIQTKNQIEIILDKSITEKINGAKVFMDSYDISPNFKFSIAFGAIHIKFNITKLDKHFIYYLVPLMELIEKAI